jgi:dTDP-4-dehydrorhamnose reductase
MKWLVTGANGQLGQALSAQLAAEGLDFAALDSKQLDITNLNQVNEVVSNLRPEVIINTAAWTDVEGAETNRGAAFKVNEKGVEYLVLAARATNSVFMHISTDYVFSGYSDKPWPENSPMNPCGVYGLSKAAGEIVIGRLFPERSYILRTAWLYSQYGQNFAKTICSLALNSEEEVRVVDDQVGQPTNAQNLASQVISLVNSRAKFGVYHGTNSGQASWFEFAKEIFKLTGANINRVIPVHSSEYPRLAERPTYSVLGQKSWHGSGTNPMQNWKRALEEAMPAILDSIEMQR